MPSISGVTPLNWVAEPSKDHPKDIKAAAQQFEALLMGQILSAMRSSAGSGWLGTGDDQSSSHMAEFGEQMMAQMLSAKGGLGLAQLVEQGLRTKNTAETAVGASVVSSDQVSAKS